MNKVGCVLLGAGITAAFGLGVWLGREICPQAAVSAPLTDFSVRCDTLIIRDTITREKPIYRVTRVTDTIVVHTSDTLRILSDSTAVVQMEQLVYEDSTYRAVVSGFRPSLDTIAVYPKHSVVTIYKMVEGQKKRWGLGVQAGYGLSRDGLSPYIGVGVSYNLLRW